VFARGRRRAEVGTDWLSKPDWVVTIQDEKTGRAKESSLGMTPQIEVATAEGEMAGWLVKCSFGAEVLRQPLAMADGGIPRAIKNRSTRRSCGKRDTQKRREGQRSPESSNQPPEMIWSQRKGKGRDLGRRCFDSRTRSQAGAPINPWKERQDSAIVRQPGRSTAGRGRIHCKVQPSQRQRQGSTLARTS
jgi:hypothetical protein